MLKKIIILLLFLFSAPAIYACSCFGTPTVSAEYKQSQVVMIVRVKSLKYKKYAEPGVDKVNGMYVNVERVYESDEIEGANMVVERVYKGRAVKTGDKLFFTQGRGADCVFVYSEKSIGDRLLIYSGIPKGGVRGTWAGYICGRDNNVKSAKDDLLYLKNLKRVRGRTRISGVIMYEEKSAITERENKSFPLAGHRVKIIGNGKTYYAVTNKDGVYEKLGLLPGRYTIIPDPYPGSVIDYSKEATDEYSQERAPAKQKAEYKRMLAKLEEAEDHPDAKGIYEVYLFSRGSVGYDFDYKPNREQ